MAAAEQAAPGSPNSSLLTNLTGKTAISLLTDPGASEDWDLITFAGSTQQRLDKIASLCFAEFRRNFRCIQFA